MMIVSLTVKIYLVSIIFFKNSLGSLNADVVDAICTVFNLNMKYYSIFETETATCIAHTNTRRLTMIIKRDINSEKQ